MLSRVCCDISKLRLVCFLCLPHQAARSTPFEVLFSARDFPISLSQPIHLPHVQQQQPTPAAQAFYPQSFYSPTQPQPALAAEQDGKYGTTFHFPINKRGPLTLRGWRPSLVLICFMLALGQRPVVDLWNEVDDERHKKKRKSFFLFFLHAKPLQNNGIVDTDSFVVFHWTRSSLCWPWWVTFGFPLILY
jgi:hypothetical protein